MTDFNFDLDARKVYAQVQLLGESETIEVWLENFAVINDEGSYKVIVEQARSNRLWLNNLLSRIAGKAWKIPPMPQFAAQLELVSELFKAENPVQEEKPQQENA